MASILSKPELKDLTTSTKAVDIQDVAFWIYSFIESNRDRASFSAIRRNVYHFLLEHRVKYAVIHTERLASFTSLLQNNSYASKFCVSLMVCLFAPLAGITLIDMTPRLPTVLHLNEYLISTEPLWYIALRLR